MTDQAAQAPVVWRSRIVGHGKESPEQLLANPLNSYKIHPTEQQQAVQGLIDEVGVVKSVIVNRSTGYVLDGHLRVALAISRREEEIDVEYVELTEEEEALVIVALDYTAGMSAVDREELKNALQQVKPKSQSNRALMEAIARDAGIDLNDVDEESVPPAHEDRIAEAHEKWGAKLGDVWTIPSLAGMGAHRLVCGDSTDESVVQQALRGYHVNLMVTDPPYGVEYDAEWRAEVRPNANYATGKVENDDIVDWTPALSLFPGNVMYVWHAGIFAGEVAASIHMMGFGIRAQIIWAKQVLVMSRGHYHWQHEPCWYAVRKGASGNWKGDRKQSTVWNVKNMSNASPNEDDHATGHSTQKPAEVMRRPILNHTDPGEAVYDPFSGSSTTIAAAETVGRLGVGIELNPEYVSLSLERFSQMGMEPQREE